MTFSVVPETIEEFERQFGRERIATAVAGCGIRVSRPDMRLPDDQRRALFQRLMGTSADPVTSSSHAPGADLRSTSSHETRTAERSTASASSSIPTAADLATSSSTGTASNDTNRLLRRIGEEQRARANTEQALREQRSLAEARRNQIEQRDSELRQMADVERDLRQAIDEWSGDLEWMNQSLYEYWMHFRWPDTRVRGGRQHASVRKASARSRVAPTAARPLDPTTVAP